MVDFRAFKSNQDRVVQILPGVVDNVEGVYALTRGGAIWFKASPRDAEWQQIPIPNG